MTRVTRVLIAGCVVVASATLYGGQAQPPAVTPSPAHAALMSTDAQQATLKQYCVTCHNSRTKPGFFVLEGVDVSHVSENAEPLEKVVRRLRAGMMPPPGAPRPDAATLDSLATSLETALDQAAVKPNLVPPGVHRLNRTEYANAIRDLLDLDIDPAAYLPVDDSSSGFDNVAGSLGISPALVEGYMSAAGKISRTALGREIAPQEKRFIAPQDYSQEDHVEVLPFGSRGGMLIRYNFPADGEYVISWFPVRGN